VFGVDVLRASYFRTGARNSPLIDFNAENIALFYYSLIAHYILTSSRFFLNRIYYRFDVG